MATQKLADLPVKPKEVVMEQTKQDTRTVADLIEHLRSTGTPHRKMMALYGHETEPAGNGLELLENANAAPGTCDKAELFLFGRIDPGRKTGIQIVSEEVDKLNATVISLKEQLSEAKARQLGFENAVRLKQEEIDRLTGLISILKQGKSLEELRLLGVN